MIRSKTRPVKICTGKRKGEKIKVKDLIRPPRLFFPDAVVPDSATKKTDYQVITLQKNIKVVTANVKTIARENELFNKNIIFKSSKQIKEDKPPQNDHDYCLPIPITNNLSKLGKPVIIGDDNNAENKTESNNVTPTNKISKYSNIDKKQKRSTSPIMSYDDILSYGLIYQIENEGKNVECEIENVDEKFEVIENKGEITEEENISLQNRKRTLT